MNNKELFISLMSFLGFNVVKKQQIKLASKIMKEDKKILEKLNDKNQKKRSKVSRDNSRSKRAVRKK